MANSRERRKCAFFTLLALCIAVTVSAIVLGLVSFEEMSAGKTTNAWYLVGAASVAILLLPFVATPLTWVAVELLVRQARDSAPARASDEIATDTADTELQTREISNLPSRRNGSVSDSGDWTQTEEPLTKEKLAKSTDAALVAASIEGTNPPAKMKGHNSETAGGDDVQSLHNASPALIADSAKANERKPSDVLSKEGQFLEVELYKAKSNRIDHSKFQRLNTPACGMMYAGLMCLCLSFMSLMWNIFIGVRYNAQQDYFWPSIVCNIALNILCPAFAMLAILLILNVVMYTSAGQIDIRVIYCNMLSSVKIVNGTMIHPPKLTFKFWVIGDLFYIRLKSPRGNPRQLHYYIDRTPATHCLAAVVFQAFTIAAWLYLERMLVEGLTITTPIRENDCRGYTCLHGLTPVSCNDALNITGTVTLKCVLFRFQFNIFTSFKELITAVLVYIAAVQLMKYIIITVSILLLIYHTKIWGLILLIIHILLFIAILVIVIVVESIDVPSKAKLIAIPLVFIPMVFLLLSGGVKEVIEEPERTRGIMVLPRQYYEGLQHMNALADAPSPESKA